MPPLNEENTKLRLITPAITAAGWPLDHIEMEYPITDGQVQVESSGWCSRKAPAFADYLLLGEGGFPLAVVEAKSESHTPEHGIQQAIRYATMLDLPFAYSSNGHGFVERDLLTGIETSLAMDKFPSPASLWERYKTHKNLASAQEKVLTHPYHFEQGMHKARYYQRIAINRTVDAIAKGQKRVLLVMATGTGKTFTAFHIIKQLRDTGLVKKVLYLADRNVLVDQTMAQDFKPFQKEITKVQGGHIDTSYNIFMALYQQLSGDADVMDEEAALAPFKQVKPEFFDLVIVDECHRGSAKANSNWRRILEYFQGAVQLGLTATPKETGDVSTSEYFGKAVYTYSLGQGIADGFLAPYRIKKYNLDIDVQGYDVKKGDKDINGKPFEKDEHFERSAIPYKIVVDSREIAVADIIDKHLRDTCRFDKSIVFCANTDHASRMRQRLINLNSDIVREHANYVVRITGDDPEGKRQLDNFTDKGTDFPVIATTSQLLSTGVDTKTCKLIVIDKEIGSQTEFKQIIGRGTRLVEKYGKMYFTIMDFRGACDMFYDPDFDGDPLPPDTGGEKPGIKKPRPGGPKPEPVEKHHVAGNKVNVATYTEQYIGPDGKLTTESLIDYTQRTVTGKYATLDDFLRFWRSQERKSVIIDNLAAEDGLDLTFLRQIPGNEDMDEMDLICQLAYSMPRKTRKERAAKVRQEFWAKYSEPAQKVLHALLDKYSDMGIGAIELEKSRQLLLTPELAPLGGRSAVKYFGTVDDYNNAVQDLVNELYAAA